MSKHHLKLLIWAGLVAFIPLLVFAGLRLLGDVFSSVNEGANPETALNIVPNVPPDLQVRLDWNADDSDTGRTIEPYTRELVESAYLRAWLQWNLSYAKGEPYGLATYFTGPALEAIEAGVRQTAQQGIVIEQSDTAHALTLHFYSADGSIIAFTDTRAVVAQVVRDSDGRPIYAGETWATYDVVMLLQDGNWAVRHWVRRSDDTPRSLALAQPIPGFVTASGASLTLNGTPYDVAGINYYPADTPWDLFWSQYDGAVIDRDFVVIRGLGLNTIRIFIPYWQFGGPQPDESYLSRLDDLLERASTNQIKVIVTLFDFRVDYRLLSWPAGDRHLETIVPRYRDNPAILAWDLKNEPDRDYGHGRDNVDAWLRHVALVVRGLDSHHLITIGWSMPTAASTLAAEVDIVSFHFYAPAAELPEAYAALRSAAANRPILLGEFGLPTWNSWLFPNGHTEREQAAYYADVLGIMRSTDSAGYLAWTLYDFANVPPSVAGRFPWQIGPQKHLGVLQSGGEPKPAAALLAPGASLDVPREAPLARFFKPFWLMFAAVVGSGLAIMLLSVRFIWRKLRHRSG